VIRFSFVAKSKKLKHSYVTLYFLVQLQKKRCYLYGWFDDVIGISKIVPYSSLFKSNLHTGIMLFKSIRLKI